MKQKVYIQTDKHNRIVRCKGGYAALEDLTDWICIDEGTGDKYNLCQTHYFPGGPSGLTNPDQTHRYIYDPDRSLAYREATPEELIEERAEIEAARVPPGPTAQQLVQQQITDLDLRDIEQGQTLTDLEIGGNYIWPTY